MEDRDGVLLHNPVGPPDLVQVETEEIRDRTVRVNPEGLKGSYTATRHTHSPAVYELILRVRPAYACGRAARPVDARAPMSVPSQQNEQRIFTVSNGGCPGIRARPRESESDLVRAEVMSGRRSPQRVGVLRPFPEQLYGSRSLQGLQHRGGDGAEPQGAQQRSPFGPVTRRFFIPFVEEEDCQTPNLSASDEHRLSAIILLDIIDSNGDMLHGEEVSAVDTSYNTMPDP